MLKALTEKEIIDQLHDSEKWIIGTQELQRVWTFANFQEAMSFILRVAFLAEQHTHHPVISNVYNRVELRLNTHDADNQVTELDVTLANSINQIGFGDE
jgi:4a-hydroxytetrahydrobiopterin dehydratase